MRVEVLSRTGWTDVGDYRPDRARTIVDGLRSEGQVARLEGETLPRPRICWTNEDKTGALLGKIDDITLFVVDPPPLRSRGRSGGKWFMHVLLPGYQDLVFEQDGQIGTIDAAEQLLDRFQWRIGVRGWRNPQEAVNQGDEPTQVLPAVGEVEK